MDKWTKYNNIPVAFTLRFIIHKYRLALPVMCNNYYLISMIILCIVFTLATTTLAHTSEATDDLDRTALLGGSLGASLLVLAAGITILFIVIFIKKSECYLYSILIATLLN